ncbi:MAG TPA: DNA repair protein RecO [Verrucomicrobiae bacterium]|nr:DNA repair protein RecO [Verrucomicrobiae bacterium]
MNAPQHVTDAIVLTRTDYGEADRILTLLTPTYGKVRLMAKGVRRVRSKLAGSIELFSVTNVTFVKGRGDIGTLVSARLQTYYGRIVQNIDRTMLGYELIKQLHKVTEDELESDYFQLLEQAFIALDDPTISCDLIRVWFSAQLLRLSGHTPNLRTEPDGTKLATTQRYEFSFDDRAFMARPDAPYDADVIKFLRLIFNGNIPHILARVESNAEFVARCQLLVVGLRRATLRE